jgi:hypothetical protein
MAEGRYNIPPRQTEFYGIVHQLLPLASGARGSQDNVQIDGQSDFIIDKQSAVYDSGQAKIRIEVSPGMFTEDVPFFISAIGKGLWPNVMSGPLLIPRGSQFNLRADDRQTVQGTNNIRILHIGRKYYDRPFQSGRIYTSVKPMRLTANFTADDGGVGTVAANATTGTAIPIPADWDFEIRKLVLLADGDFSFQVMTTGKALLWFNRFCHSGLCGGTNFEADPTSGAWPFILPSPVLVPATGAIQLQLTDLGKVVGGGANRIQVIFQGNRLQPRGGLAV